MCEAMYPPEWDRETCNMCGSEYWREYFPDHNRCPSCENVYEIFLCDNCHGSGYDLSSPGHVCPECFGKGYILDSIMEFQPR